MAEGKPTQKEVILKHLQQNGRITSWEAIEKYRITRLASIICTLRKAGHWIESRDHRKESSYFKGMVTYTEYIYHGYISD